MKKFLALAFFVALFFFSMAQTARTGSECDPGLIFNAGYSKAKSLDSIMNRYTTNALPGISLAVYTEKEGWWAAAAGLADIEKKIQMDNCHLQYLQSVTKTYLAVVMLQLKAAGKIAFDQPIGKYLPVQFARYIKGHESITVRMLLNHTSGVPEYNDQPQFVSQVIEHPLKNFSAIDCLKSIEQQELQFAPGSKYKYTNTNYLLLSLVADAITGDHAVFMKANIFKTLGLKNTYYSADHNYLGNLNLPESYWDVFNNGKPANVTGFQQMTVASSKGDDGIVCTTTDAIRFMKGLMEGKLLKPESMKEMLSFVKDDKGNNRYGMGLFYFDLGGPIAYGHGGGGIGAGCGLMYIPSHKTYVFFATNLGVLIESDLVKKAGEFRNAVLAALLQ